MHGRLKVRTTEEERERKKKEQLLKVRAYKTAMAKIQKKRDANELDDEMLQITTQILLRNPDISTLWNLRRECVLLKVKSLCVEKERLTANEQVDNVTSEDLESDVVDKPETLPQKPAVESIDEQIQNVYASELSLTEQCLMINPKSYNGWHHRCWTLEQNPQADWQRELHLCNKYLKLDERNFHTWDYRRYITTHAATPKEQELEFCTEKIKVNFSNYSSWHQRSLLLPELYPYKGEAQPKRPMSEDKLKEELEMVLTAAFTDPNDSSAWFYQRWLLGSPHAQLSVYAFRCNPKLAVLAFSKPTEFKAARVSVLGPDQAVLLHLSAWKAQNATKVDTIWLAPTNGFDFNANSKCSLEIECWNLPKKVLTLSSFQNSLYYCTPPESNANYTLEVRDELKSQLESCENLLEYEPESKWTLLTSALIMRAIDAKENHEKSLSYLLKLQTVDTLRLGYYEDLASKWALAHQLALWCASDDMPGKLDLSAVPQLKSLHYKMYFAIANEVVLSRDLEERYSNGLLTFDKLEL